MSISQQQRISQKTSFLPALKGEKSTLLHGLQVYTTPSAGAKIGILIPKKCIALSIDRHRLRRRIAEILTSYTFENEMIVVRVTKKIDTEVDLGSLATWIDCRSKNSALSIAAVSSPSPNTY